MISDPFVAQLVELCAEMPTRAKWVFVPHQGLRWTLAERLLMENCSWANLRLVTPFSLALEASAPDLVAEGIHPCPDSLGPSLLRNLLQCVEGSHFSRVAELPGTAEALWRTLMDVRLAGLKADELQSLPPGARRDEWLALVRAYEQLLVERRWADRADILRTPPRQSPIHPDDPVLTYPYHRWSYLEWQWIQASPGRHRAPRGPRLQAPGRGWVQREMVEAATLSPPRFSRSLRRQEEIDNILQLVIEQGLAFDEVEIIASADDEALLVDRLGGLGIACTFEAGLAAANTRAGQALQRLLRWLEQDCNGYAFCELLRENLLQAPPDNPRALRLLEAAPIGGSRSTYARQFEVLRRRIELQAQELLPDLERLQGWLEGIFRRFPPPDSQGTVGAQRWLEGLQLTLKHDVEGVPAVSQQLVAMLEELKQLPGSTWTLEALLQQLQQRLEKLRVLASRPRPGSLHVARPESLGLSGRQHLFWVGVEEGKVQRSEHPDCVLSDSERQKLSPWLPLARERNADFQQHLIDRLATRRGQLSLSYARLDNDGEQPQVPDWLFFQGARESHPEVSSFDSLEAWLGPARGPVAPPRVSPEALGQCFPWLKRARLAQQQRQSAWLTSYDGRVAEAAGLWDPRRSGEVWSVSRLQALASCPFQFFLEQGLGLRAPALEPPLPDQWLDSATRGTVLHEVFARYHRQLRSRGWRPHADRDRDLLKSLLNQQLNLIRESQPPPSGSLEQSERRALQQDLERFLQLELESLQRQPVAFEVGFGLGPDPEEALTSPEPVELGLTPALSLKLRGRIDRIDRLEKGYSVVDYKTGRRLYVARQPVHLDRGRLLQHALYARVAEQLLRRAGCPEAVVQTSYYFPTRAAEVPWVDLEPIPTEQLGQVLEWVLEPLAQGAFFHTHEPDKDCRFCPYQAACEAHDPLALKSKLENPAEGLLEGRRRLLEVR